MKKSILFSIAFSVVMLSALSYGLSLDIRNKEKIIGSLIKQGLENFHYRRMKINDEVSRKAFPEFLKQIDHFKNFLLQSDVKKLEKYRLQMDDQLVSGDHKLLNLAMSILHKRIKKADAIRKKVFKKPFDFNRDEYLELDPEKRSYIKDENGFEDHWRKIFKYATLNRYLVFIEEAKEEDKKENTKKKKGKKEDKKKKPAKKLTDQEMIAKAHDAIFKKYGADFSRMLKESHFENLEKFFNSIAEIFDPHTLYFAPRRKESFDIEISGSLEGIGAVLQESGPYIKVIQIVPGGAAWRQKELEVSDIILMVREKGKAPVDLVDLRVDDAVGHIRGKKGTEVILTVKKADGERKTISIIRDVIQIGAYFAKSSVLKHKKLKHKIGYILLPKFYRDFGKKERNCTKDVQEEIKRLKKEKVAGIILDLRNNGGGALDDALQMSGLFIKKGPVVQVKSHGSVQVMSDNDAAIAYRGPLIVMVNRFSASASEILAGAMQDYKRGVIVGGEYTHGKGTVQTIIDLNQGPLRRLVKGGMGALKVTIQKFYRISGGSNQYKGITPDIILPDPLGYLENREQDLEHSLPWDKVPAQKFIPWSAPNNISKLREQSKKRGEKNDSFQKIKQSVAYFVGRRKNTYTSLNKNKVMQKDKESRKKVEKFKIDKESKDIAVSHFEASLRSHEKVAKGDEEHWKKDFQDRKKEWVEGLRNDPMLEESLHIMEDMIVAQAKKG